MPEQNHTVPGRISIVATEASEAAALLERQKVAELLGQIDAGLVALEETWDGMTAAQRAELLRQIEIRELKVWRFVIRKVAPRLAG